MSEKGEPKARSSEERVVVRDKRKVDSGTAKGKPGSARPAAPSTGPPEPDPKSPAAGEATATTTPDAGPGTDESTVDPAVAEPAADTVVEGDVVEPEVVEAGEPVQEAEPTSPLGAELAALRSELEERTNDLLRVSAEYANYRKRVDRDRGLVAEQATGAVVATLLPVLDDLDRAREHGDLVGPLAGMAEQLTAALAKFGLTPFGEKGDPFDPTLHEAVAHQTSPDVSESTCVEVMRRGYLLGERLLRPAMVAVADPE